MDVFVAGGWRVPARGEVVINGAWRRINRAETYRAGQWRTALSFVPPLSVNAYSVSGFASNNKPTRVTSSPTVATPTGGLGPYTYTWTILSGGAAATNPNNASTAFGMVVPPGGEIVSMARVTCTDASGLTDTAEITITLTNDGGF